MNVGVRVNLRLTCHQHTLIGMARELHKCLISYFTQLEKSDIKWKEWKDAVNRPLEGLRNQGEQLRFVTSKDVDEAELCNVDSLRSKLIFKILMGLEDEVALILNILTQFNKANQDLKNRLKNLEDARSKVLVKDESMAELVNGTAYRPRLDLLLKWAVDGFEYYHELYVRINKSMKELDYKDEETIDKLTKSLIEDRFQRCRIDRVLGFTQFLIKETVR